MGIASKGPAASTQAHPGSIKNPAAGIANRQDFPLSPPAWNELSQTGIRPTLTGEYGMIGYNMAGRDMA
jgi:hypothetical protein